MLSKRQEALALGLPTYNTGAACKRGHFSDRRTDTKDCIECKAERSAAWSKNSRPHIREYRAGRSEIINARAREKYALSPDKKKVKVAAYRSLNLNAVRVKVAKAASLWRTSNPSKAREINIRRRASELKALPGWFGELDRFIWEQASELCKLRERHTGIRWCRDHTEPLKAKDVCGLHVWNNCQVIPFSVNSMKKNRRISLGPFGL